MLKKIPVFLLLAFCLLTSFTGFAFAADAATPDDGTLLDLLRPVYDAFAQRNYLEAACLAVILVLALVKRWSGSSNKFGKFVHSDLGGTAMALMIGVAGAMATALATPGAHVTWPLLKTSLYVGVGAAGGFAVLKNLVIEPLQKYLPAWAQPVLSIVGWIFDHGPGAGQEAIAKADAAGEAAVKANPAQGAAEVLGQPAEIK